MEVRFRCNCPITSALDVLGDKWILVIAKQMLMEGAQTFKDFVESDESIATNILSSKLKIMEGMDLVTKSKAPENRKTNIYRLTDKGIALAPVIASLAQWSDAHLRDLNPGIPDGEAMEAIRANPAAFAEVLVDAYRRKHL